MLSPTHYSQGLKAKRYIAVTGAICRGTNSTAKLNPSDPRTNDQPQIQIQACGTFPLLNRRQTWLLWYNRKRLHSTLKYVSPIKFEQQWQDRPEAIAGRPDLARESRLWKSRKAKPVSQLSHSLDYYGVLTGYGIRILRARSVPPGVETPCGVRAISKPHVLRSQLHLQLPWGGTHKRNDSRLRLRSSGSWLARHKTVRGRG
jgi:hypothetical protein